MVERHRASGIDRGRSVEPRRASSRRRGAAPAQRLYETSFPINGTLAETYLRSRGLEHLPDFEALRFQPHYYYRSDEAEEAKAWPVLIAPVTDLERQTQGVYRIWLSPHGKSTIPVDPSRQGLGDLVGNAVRFGLATDVAVVSLSIEVILSLRAARPDLAGVAGLTPDLLRVIAWPGQLRQLYIARDTHPGNGPAYDNLAARVASAGIDVHSLTPRGRDFNEDLRSFGLNAVRSALLPQLSIG
jgi:hypothetical protein